MDTTGIQIHRLVPNDALEVKKLLREVWINTYPNEAEGITVQDVDAFFSAQLSDENVEKFRKK